MLVASNGLQYGRTATCQALDKTADRAQLSAKTWAAVTITVSKLLNERPLLSFPDAVRLTAGKLIDVLMNGQI